MIKLVKGPKPLILQTNATQWTTDALVYFNAGQTIPDSVINKYAHPQVKPALIIETSGKCAYCESKILHVDYGDIEHIIPKRKNPATAFEWGNLTLACGVCNTNKGDCWQQPSLLLNPYKDKIPEHLKAFSTFVLHVNGSKKGEFTHIRLDLNRGPLQEKRREAIAALHSVIDMYHREKNAFLKDIYKDQILDMTKSDKEHSLTLKCYAIAQNLTFVN